MHGTAALLHVGVHESRRYTLAQTVLGTSHFLREIPIDLIMALFIVAAAGQHGWLRTERFRSRRLAPAFALAAILIVGWSLVDAVAVNGWEVTLQDLLQYRTRDGEFVPGSHWNTHLLSTLWLAWGLDPSSE